MSFFKKLKNKLFKSSSKIDEGLEAIVEDGGEVDEAAEAEAARLAEQEQARAAEAEAAARAEQDRQAQEARAAEEARLVAEEARRAAEEARAREAEEARLAEEPSARAAEAARVAEEERAREAAEQAEAEAEAARQAELAAAEERARAAVAAEEEARIAEARAEEARAAAAAQSRAAAEDAERQQAADLEAQRARAAEAEAAAEAARRIAAEEAAARKAAAEVEQERLREAEAAAEAARARAAQEAAARQAEAEAERERQAQAEAERARQAEDAAEQARQAEAEAERARQAEAEAQAARLAEIEAEAQAEREAAEAEAVRQAQLAAREAVVAPMTTLGGDALGEDASEPEEKKGLLGRLFGRESKTVVRRTLDDDMLERLEELLIQADMGVDTALRVTANMAEGRFGKKLSVAEIKDLLAAEVTRIMEPVAKPMPLYPSKPQVVLVVGVNGSGKTTTIGKLASQFKAAGKKVVIAAGDTFRAAAVEQLQVWGERAGVPVLTAPEGSDPASLAFDAMAKAQADGADLLMIDTAGRLQNRADLMEELAKIVRVIKKKDPDAPHNTLLVLDATTGQNALLQVEIFRKIAEVSGLVMTKLDGTAKGGVLVALADKFGLPIHAIGVGEQIDDLAPFDAREFAEALVGVQS